ncbi:MoxR family ATPase [Streptomyces antnestii]|uniref:MoxR family ATPase n=1 Tax=Streptomyces antnestii TaxID=2494256 RepID=A0A3S2W466_9ACTN|nr:MoxR family ATPase [Streptomyces sp. San01]RVU27462.1 MoxR family ATPase [Streptomyces sp. San01]
MADRDPHVPGQADGAAADPGAWRIYRGTARPRTEGPVSRDLPPPPPWRRFTGAPLITDPPPGDEDEFTRRLGPPDGPVVRTASEQELDLVNAALFLRRPLIVAGPPGIGKSSLAHCISRELSLGRVLRWSITSRSSLKEGLYAYDAIGRVQEAATRGALRGSGPGAPDGPAADPDGLNNLGDYVQLGPLGTALLPRATPRVLLVDEFDKSDTDLAGDLLSVFEEGEFRIPELARVRSRLPEAEVHTDDPDGTAVIHHGHVRCAAFPVVVITSNGERTLPPALLRRCLYLDLPAPDAGQLAAMLAAQLSQGDEGRTEMIRDFLSHARTGGSLAADQLLNSEFLRTTPAGPGQGSMSTLLHALWRRLDEVGTG